MHPLNAGDVVRCIDDKPLSEKIIRIGEPWVKAGRVYRVASTSTCAVSGNHGVVLREVNHWPPGAGWHAWRFRKIEPADEAFRSELREILEPANA